MSTSPSRKFDMQLDIAAPKDAVWKAITSDAEIARWFSPEADVTPGEGGSVVWRWPGLFEWPQSIETWQPGERLRTRYKSPVEDGHGGYCPLFIDFELSGEGGSTTLRIVHSGFGADAAFDEEYDGIRHGWPIELRSLRHYLEHHAGKERYLAWSRVVTTLPKEEGWARLTGAGGLGCGPEIARLGEGEPFRIETTSGDRFEGTALECGGTSFTGVATSHDDAFLRIGVEDCTAREAQLWLAAYGRPGDGTEQRMREQQARWDALLGQLFEASPAPASSR